MNTFKLEFNGAVLSGVVGGAGVPVVFLHAGVADLRMWLPQLEGLVGEFRVVAFDRRGFGGSVAGGGVFSHVDDLGGVLDFLGLGGVHLVGCSQGGRVAIDFCLAFPERVRSLCLFAPAVSGAPAPDEGAFSGELLARVEALEAAEASGDVDAVNALEAVLWLDGPESQEGRVGGRVRELFLNMNGVALRHPELLHEQGAPSAYERVHEIAVPTKVVWGGLDFGFVVARCEYLVARVSGAVGVEVAGAAHLVNMEEPEFVNGLLREFFGMVR